MVDLVGPVEIAKLLGVQLATVYRWRTRNVLPDPQWTISGSPIWERTDILQWAMETNRWDPELNAPPERLAS